MKESVAGEHKIYERKIPGSQVGGQTIEYS